jgi:hypothetical protein
MPVLPVLASPPYDTVDSCVIAARVKVNDAMQSLSGDTLQYQYPFTQITVNNAWRQLKNYLSDKSQSRLHGELIIGNLPPAAVQDPATQVNLSWVGYYDGNNLFNQIVLPPYFKNPLWVCERISGQPYGFGPPMRNCIDGLPQPWKQPLNLYWEWREDALYMPGATAYTDLRIRFNLNLSDFLNVGDPPSSGKYWYQLQVPILDCQQAFANFIAAEFVGPRADADYQRFIQMGQAEADMILNRDIQAKQRTNSRRQPFSVTQNVGGWGNGGWGNGYQNY